MVKWQAFFCLKHTRFCSNLLMVITLEVSVLSGGVTL